MEILRNLLLVVLEEGFIYGIMAVGIYITYHVLHFPDLSVDGTFPLGACLTVVLLGAGVHPVLACALAFGAGALAGLVTGLLHVKLHITDLLSGILVMTGLWSINLATIMGGKASIAIFDAKTIFNSGLASYFPESLAPYRVVIIAGFVCLAAKYLVDAFLNTKTGLLLRAAGDNPQYVVAQGEDPGRMKILGLMIGNGCTALSGSVLAQQAQNANVASGTGMVVMALASVIIGMTVFRNVKFLRATSAVVAGAIIYKACLSGAMQLGLDTNYLKLLMAVIFTFALVTNRITLGRRRKPHVDPTKL